METNTRDVYHRFPRMKPLQLLLLPPKRVGGGGGEARQGCSSCPVKSPGRPPTSFCLRILGGDLSPQEWQAWRRLRDGGGDVREEVRRRWGEVRTGENNH